jgi:hypothetical protein
LRKNEIDEQARLVSEVEKSEMVDDDVEMEKPRGRRRRISKEVSESSESDNEELCDDEDEIVDNP